MLDELKILVGELYELYGATTQVVKLSQILDELIVEAQKNNQDKQKKGKKSMEVKVSFDRKELEKWFYKDCQIPCEECPIEGHICDTLVSKAHTEYYK